MVNKNSDNAEILHSTNISQPNRHIVNWFFFTLIMGLLPPILYCFALVLFDETVSFSIILSEANFLGIIFCSDAMKNLSRNYTLYAKYQYFLLCTTIVFLIVNVVFYALTLFSSIALLIFQAEKHSQHSELAVELLEIFATKFNLIEQTLAQRCLIILLVITGVIDFITIYWNRNEDSANVK